MKTSALTLAVLLFAAVSIVNAQMPEKAVKIGVLTDMSSIFADSTGAGSVLAARMAAEDYGGKVAGVPIEIVYADHQNKPDVGSNIVRRWIDVDKIDAIADVPNSGVALAVIGIVRDKNKVLLASGPASSDVTGKACSPNTVQWTFDTWALANTTARAVVKAGGDTWFFLTADYAFGHALERDASNIVIAAGGKVLGSVRHPINTSDFSSYLQQAKASQAKIIALAMAGGDNANAIKTAAEFGISKGGQQVVTLLIFLSDIHALGLEVTQGLLLAESFYWDLNAGTRAWSQRFAARNNGKYPTMAHAGVYSSVLHYLKAVDSAKTVDGKLVVAKMKELPTDDPLFGKNRVREDGREIHNMYLFEVKKPSESKGPYDYYKLRDTIPAERAFRPIDQGDCPLVKKGGS